LFVTLKVYDILGRKVATLVNKKQAPGNYSATFDTSKLTLWDGAAVLLKLKN